MSKTRYILYSTGLGFLLAVFSIAIAITTFSSEESIWQSIFLWNFFLGGYLAIKGLLPMCFDCELLTLFYSFVDAFIVGVIGYSLIIFVCLWLFNKLRNRGKYGKETF